MQTEKFDVVIAGAGLAGLTLAMEMAARPFFRHYNILLIDREEKIKNDRTWCFWAKDEEHIPPVIHKSWNNCRFFSHSAEIPMRIAPYRYHMVRGIDFYRHAHERISQHPGNQRLIAPITSIEASTGIVHTTRGSFQGNYVFNSAITSRPLLPPADARFPEPPLSRISDAPKDPHYTWMLQHFKGWVIETPEPVFDADTATFMDYRIDQKGETRFMYVLPLTTHRALVEFTVFSSALCPAEEYDVEIRNYLYKHLNIKHFSIEETEFGVIPMTDFPAKPIAEGHVISIGTVGGFVKPSSGYAFKRTQRKMKAFVDAWEKTGTLAPEIFSSQTGFKMLDSIMLRVLRDQLVPGDVLFSQLFRKLDAPHVFRFLDEDATFAETVRLVMAPPTLPFLKAAWRQAGNWLRGYGV